MTEVPDRYYALLGGTIGENKSVSAVVAEQLDRYIMEHPGLGKICIFLQFENPLNKLAFREFWGDADAVMLVEIRGPFEVISAEHEKGPWRMEIGN